MDMKNFTFKSYKIAPSLPLKKIESFFRISRQFTWKEYIVLEGEHIETVLKYAAGSRKVFLFKFGCATFINFSEHEIHTFLKYLESITDNVKIAIYTEYSESHNITVSDNGKCRLWDKSEETIPYGEYILHAVSIVLAKSVELNLIEKDASELLDESESFIIHLQKGVLRASTRKFTKTISKILKFEYNSVNSIKIYDRPVSDKYPIESRAAYDSLAKYYELHKRFDAIHNKINNLREIIKSYSSLSYKKNEFRLLAFEIFLLILFPLSRLLLQLWENGSIMSVINRIIK